MHFKKSSVNSTFELTDRFVKQVKVMTFKDVNVEEIGNRELEIPKEFAVGE